MEIPAREAIEDRVWRHSTLRTPSEDGLTKLQSSMETQMSRGSGFSRIIDAVPQFSDDAGSRVRRRPPRFPP